MDSRNYCSTCRICNRKRAVGFPNGATPHLDEHEPRWIVAENIFQNTSQYGTPSFSTIVTGFVVAVPALFLNLDTVIALTSIGTLFAFVLVCAGILVLNQMKDKPESKFKVPYLNGKYILPFFVISGTFAILKYLPNYFQSLLSIEGFPMIIFFATLLVITILTYLKNFSLIPVLGFTSCFYLMAQESHTNWFRFLIWLLIGLVIYFLYGIRKSKLNNL